MADYILSAKITGDASDFAKAFKIAEESADSFKQKMNNIGKGFSSVGKSLTGIGDSLISHVTKPALVAATALAGVTLGKGWARMSQIDNAKVKLEAIGNSAEDVKEIMNNATASVKGTAYGLNEAASTAASAVAAGIAPGQQLEGYLTAVADAAAVAGTDMGSMGAIFNKVATQGKANNEVLQQMAEAGIPIYQYLADEMGVTADAVFDMASRGEIDLATFQSAVENHIGGAAKVIGSKTISGAISNIGAAISRIGANFLGSADDANSFAGQVLPLLNEFKDFLGTIEDKTKEWGATFGEVFGTIVEYCKTGNANLTEVSDTAARISEKLFPVIDVVKNVATAFMDLPPAAQVGLGAGTLLAGPLLSALGKISSGISGIFPMLGNASTHFGGLSKSISNAGGMGQYLSGALSALASPVTIVIAAIAALVAAFVYLMTTNETFRTTVMEVASSIATAVAPIFQAFGTLLSTIATSVMTLFAAAVTALAPVFTTIVEIIGQVITTMAPLVTMILELLTSIVTGIMSFVVPAFQGILTVVTVVFEALAPIIEGALTIIQGIIEVVMAIINAIWHDDWTEINNFVSNILSVIESVIQSVITAIKDFISNAWKTIQEITSNVFEAISSFLSGIWNGIKSFVSSVVSAISSAVSNAWNAISSTTQGIFSSVSSFISGIWEGIKSFISTTVENIKTKASETFESMKTAISDTCGRISSVVQDGFQGAIDFITSLPGKALGWGMDFINGLADGIVSAAGGVLDSVRNIADQISSLLHFSRPDKGPLRYYEKWMPDFMHGLSRGIDSNIGVVKRSISKVADQLAFAAPGIDVKYGTEYVMAMSDMGRNHVEGVANSTSIMSVNDSGDRNLGEYIVRAVSEHGEALAKGLETGIGKMRMVADNKEVARFLEELGFVRR